MDFDIIQVFKKISSFFFIIYSICKYKNYFHYKMSNSKLNRLKFHFKKIFCFKLNYFRIKKNTY